MNQRHLALLLLLAAPHPSGAHAQGVGSALRPGPSPLIWQRPRAELTHTRGREPLGGLLGPDDEDYRYTGFFVGAGLGLATTLLFVVGCQADVESCNASDLTGMLVGGVAASTIVGIAGAVIGGFFPK